MPQIEVTFDIDANGIVHVSAKDLGTGKEQSMTITGGSALPKEDIDRMMREAEEYAEEDKRRREEVETRNQAEGLYYGTEKFLAENDEKIPAETKDEVQAALDRAQDRARRQDADAVKTAAEKLGEVSQKMGAAMYAEAQAAAAGGAPEGDARRGLRRRRRRRRDRGRGRGGQGVTPPDGGRAEDRDEVPVTVRDKRRIDPETGELREPAPAPAEGEPARRPPPPTTRRAEEAALAQPRPPS